MKRTIFIVLLAIAGYCIANGNIPPICTNDEVIDLDYPLCTEDHARHALSCPEDENGNFHCFSICRNWHTILTGPEDGSLVGVTCSGTSENCTSECLGGTKCDGTQPYCDYVGARNCNPPASENPESCFCELVHYKNSFECNYRGSWFHMNSSKIEWQKNIFNYAEPTFNPNPFQPRSGWKRAIMSSTFIEFEEPDITVTTAQPNNTFVWVSKSSHNEMYTCSEAHCVITLPDKFFTTPGHIQVTVYLGDVKDNERAFHVQDYSRCPVPNCVWCWSAVTAWHCYPEHVQIFIIVFLVIFTLVLLCALPLILKILFYTCKYLFNFLKFAACGCYNRALVPASERISPGMNQFVLNLRNVANTGEYQDGDNTQVELVDMTEEEEAELERDRVRAPRRGRKLPFWMMLVMIVCLCNPAFAVCTEGFTLSSESVTCSVSGSTQSCEVTMDVLLSIPSPGASSCMSFFDEQSNQVVGELEIKYDYALSRVGLQKQYYTSGWVGVGTSNRQCPWETGCSSSSVCQNFDANSVVNPSNLLSGAALQWPGLTECSTSCGCAGCGCFSCDNACMYWRYAFQPNLLTGIWKVDSPHTYSLEPHVSASLDVDGYMTNITTAVLGFSQSIGNNYTLTVQGSLSGDLVIFGSRSVVSSGETSYLTDASPVNGPIPGAVGDLQANTPVEFMVAGTNNFIYPSGAVDVNIGTTSASFNFPPIGIDSLPNIHKLPLLVGGILWTYQGTEMTGLNPNPGTLLASIQTDQPLQITRTVNIVCPSIISATGSGCYNCQEGSIITVTAKSTCSQGLAAVSFAGATVQTTSVLLDTQEKSLEIVVQPSAADVMGTLRLSAGNYEDTIEVSWTAVLQDGVDTNRTGADVRPPPSDDGIDINWNQFGDWLDSLSSVESVLFWIAIAIGGILLIGFALYLTYKCGPFGSSGAQNYIRIDRDAAQ